MAAQQAGHTNSEHWPDLKSQVRELRKQATPMEARLWEAIRGKQLGVKFRRQHPIHRYVVDFYSVEAALAIEIDGSVHLHQVAEDTNRQAFLEANGIRFLRFSNEDVAHRFPEVIASIKVAVHSGSS